MKIVALPDIIGEIGIFDLILFKERIIVVKFTTMDIRKFPSPYADKCRYCVLNSNLSNCDSPRRPRLICDKDPLFRYGKKSYSHYYTKVNLSLFVARTLARNKIIRRYKKVMV